MRLDNLAPAPADVEQPHATRNHDRYRPNTSGVTGVRRSGARWVACIHVGGRQKHLGSFGSLEEAAAARVQAIEAITCGIAEVNADGQVEHLA